MVAASQALHLVSFWVNSSRVSATLKPKLSFSTFTQHSMLRRHSLWWKWSSKPKSTLRLLEESPLPNVRFPTSKKVAVRFCEWKSARAQTRCLPKSASSNVIVVVTPTPPVRALNPGRPSNATNVHAWTIWRGFAWWVSLITTHVTVVLRLLKTGRREEQPTTDLQAKTQQPTTTCHLGNTSNTPHLFDGIPRFLLHDETDRTTC